jgi:hypothetical protein
MKKRPDPITVICDKLPPPRLLPNGTIYGMYSCTTPDRYRFVRFDALKEWEGVKDTETAFTRKYLSSLPAARARKSQRAGFDATRPPLYVSPGPVRDGVYIDLKSAFPSIYQRVGWDVEYLRDKYIFSRDIPLKWPYPESWKVGRSYVISGARPTTHSIFISDGSLRSRLSWNKFSNPCLVACVYDTLASVARLAVTCFGCRYWNVDGGIMPAVFSGPFVEICAFMGLVARVKHRGDSFIFSSSEWYCGDKLTQRFAGKTHTILKVWGDKIPVNVSQAEWMIEHFAKVKTVK